jgi:hypothetical protein
MELYTTKPKTTINDLLTPYLPQKVLGATSREDFAHKRSYYSHIALDYCTWIQYNQKWLNMLIFDIDYFITPEDAWFLCINELGLHPSWVCNTSKGVHIGFILRDRVSYEWKKTIALAKKIKVAVTAKLKADERGSHRLYGWWRNPTTHTHYYDEGQLVSLKDFYHLLPKQTPTHRFKRELVERKKQSGDFQFKKGYRNDWLWYRAMQITKGKSEYTDAGAVYSLISSMQVYEVQYNAVEPLPSEELHRIAHSVAKYNDLGKNWVSTGVNIKKEINEGRMGFKKIKGATPSEYRAEVKRRQKLSAEKTNKEIWNMATRKEHIDKVNEIRKDATRRKILNCVTGLMVIDYKKKSGAWHYGLISKDTGVSTKTIAKYIKQFKEEGIL